MKEFAIAVVAVAVALFGALVSCGSEMDRLDCARKGRELNAESKIIGNRCVVKGWGEVR